MPYVIPYIAYAAAAISAGVSVYSAVDQAKTSRETAKYNDQAYQAEARNKEQLAAEGIRRERMQNRRKMADIRNNMAQGGYLSNEGTPLAIIGESSANLELGVQDAARAAANQANGLRAQGAMSLWEGEQQARASTIKGAGSLLSSLGSTAGQYNTDVYNGVLPNTFGIRTRKQGGY